MARRADVALMWTLLFSLVAAASAAQMPTWEEMLEERAYVLDVRATIERPSLDHFRRAKKDLPFNARLSRRIEEEIENVFGGCFLHIGHFYGPKPDLPRLVLALDFPQGGIANPVVLKGRREYTRFLSGSIRATMLPNGDEVDGIPIRVVIRREVYGEYDQIKSLRVIDVDGVRVKNGPIEGNWAIVRHLNEGILLEALRTRHPECERLLR